MSTSRRDFLLRALALGGAIAAGEVGAGCARRMEAAPVARVSPPVNGKLIIDVSLYPELQRDGGAIIAQAEGLVIPLLVTRLAGNTFSTLSALCTHASCPLGYSPEEGQVECPCHGSKFDVTSGKVTRPPAREALLAYASDYDAAAGVLTVDLLAGDPDYPAVEGGRLLLPLSSYPQLATAGGSVAFVPRGLGRPLVVVALADGSYSALDATCTHQGCTVDYVPDQGDLECPCHGSTFTLQGQVTQGPAIQPLASFTAVRTGDSVMVQVS